MATPEEKLAQEQIQKAADAKDALPAGEEKPAQKPDEDPPEKKPEGEQLDPTKANTDSILNMDIDDLGKMDEHLSEHPEEITEEPEKPPGSEQKPDKKPGEEEKPTGEEKPPGEETPPEEDPKDKIIADQRSELTKLQQQRAKNEQEAESAEWKGYAPPKDEDLDILYDEDREAYDIAIDRQKRYEIHLEDKSHSEIEGAHTENIDAVLGFLSVHKKVELNDASRAELIKNLKDPESEDTKLIIELDNYLQTNTIPSRRVTVGKDENGNAKYLPVYSKEQIVAANNLLHMSDIIKSREDTIRTETAKKIEDAAKGGSAFDRMETPAAGDVTSVKPENLSQQDILHMDEDQLKHVDKMYNPEG